MTRNVYSDYSYSFKLQTCIATMSISWWITQSIELVLIGVIGGSVVWATVKGAPWLPTNKKVIKRMLELARLLPCEIVYDLGCGDARSLIIAHDEFGATGYGIELAIPMFCVSWLRTRRKRGITIKLADLFCVSLQNADVVFLFLMNHSLAHLEQKLTEELRPGTRVISYCFQLPSWTPKQMETIPHLGTIYLYFRASE